MDCREALTMPIENLYPLAYSAVVILLIIGYYMHHKQKHEDHSHPITDHELRNFIMSTVSSLANITKLLTAGTGGSDVAGVTAANAKLDLITADLGITGTSSGPGTGTLPTITGVSPASGSINGGEVITLSGTGFTGTTAVNFGSVAGTSIGIVNDTTITVISPAQAAAIVDITVVTPLGTSAIVPADHYTLA